MLELSNNSASIARSCWMKFKFNYVDAYRPLKKDRALTLGEVVHNAFDAFYLNVPHNDILHSISTKYDASIKLCTPEEKEDLVVDKYTALGMFEFYPIDLSAFQKIETEVEFKVPLSHGIRLVGRVDGDVLQNNNFWIRELKTTSTPIKQFKARADVSYQVSGYKFAMEYLKHQTYQGVMFDVIRKPRLYKRVDDNAESFGKRIYMDYSATKFDQSKRTSYYDRHYSYRNLYQMECFKADMIKIAKEIKRRKRHNDWLRNPDACYLYNRMCEYAPVCWKKDVPKDVIDSLYTVKGAKPVEVEIPVEELE